MTTPGDALHQELSPHARIEIGLGFRVNEPAHSALSNLAPGFGFWFTDPYTNENRWAASTEHLFQASKTTDPQERDKIFKASTPKQAKFLGRAVRLRMSRKTWDDSESTKALYAANVAKYRQNPAALHLLLSTGGDRVYLYESSGDRRWGLNEKGHGENKMGLLLMRIRRELRDEREQTLAADAPASDDDKTAGREERLKRADVKQRAGRAKHIARILAREKGLIPN